MYAASPTSACGRLARIVTLGVAVLALAGCVSDYSLVQPDAAGSGSYYTSAGPYSQGYYDDGPYAVDADGFGYDGFGYDGFGLGGIGFDVGYDPSFAFGLGLGSACGWGCGAFFGGWPWYYPGFGYSYVVGWYGNGRHRRHHGSHHPAATTALATASRAGRETVPAHAPQGPQPLVVAPPRQVSDLAGRPLKSASFVPRDAAHMPVLRPTLPSDIAEGPAYASPMRDAPAFGQGRIAVPAAPMAPSRDFSAPAAPSFNAAPAPHAAPAPAPSHSHDGRAP